MSGLFDQLMGGAKFDRRRFGGDIARFQGKQDGQHGFAPPSSIDFFGTRHERAKEHLSTAGSANPHGAGAKGSGKRPRAAEVEDSDDKDDLVGDDHEDQGGEHVQVPRKKRTAARAAEDGDDEEEVQPGLFAHSQRRAAERKGEGVGGVTENAKAGRKLSKHEEARREQIAVFRKQMRIQVAGHEIPDPAGTFEEIQLSVESERWLRQGIEDSGWTEPTPIQMQAIPVIMSGRDLIACAPTGSGKTGAFVIPLFALLGGPRKQGIRGLIVAPTRELAVQIHRQCVVLQSKSKLRVKIMTKATGANIANMQQHEGGRSQDVLISTPARLVSLISEGALSLGTVELVVIDEADKLFDDGFVGQIDEVAASTPWGPLEGGRWGGSWVPS